MAKVAIIRRPGNQTSGEIKKTAWSAAFESLALLVLGILLIIFQDEMVKVLAYVVGAFFMVKGGYQVVSYYMDNGQNNFFDNRLLGGIISILIGVVSLVAGENIAAVFRVVMGVIIIYEALVRINTASKLASAGINTWRYVMILALVMLVLGIFVTFNAGAVVALVGAMLVITGVVGLVGDVMFLQHLNMLIDRFTGKDKKGQPMGASGSAAKKAEEAVEAEEVKRPKSDDDSDEDKTEGKNSTKKEK